jgi:hypothetical protein
MSLIDRLRQLVGPSDAPASDESPDLRVPAPQTPAAPAEIDALLGAVRETMEDYSALANDGQDIDAQLRYLSERLKQAERMVEREAAGTKAAIHASELAGTATARLAAVEAWQKALQESIEAGRPIHDQLNEILEQVRAYQDRARTVVSDLSLPEATARAAAAYLEKPDSDGITGAMRLQQLQRSLQQLVDRAEANRPEEAVR